MNSLKSYGLFQNCLNVLFCARLMLWDFIQTYHIMKALKQKQGTAISTKFANPYNIIFMADLEEDKMLDLEYKAFVW